ncbi:Coenzyme F420 hydrogenase/dehydrogenase, beta subunit C-terminal domain [Clostridium perfringens]
MKTYFETLEKKDCNGCGVCSLKCPKNAIKMIEDYEGFLYPKIDSYKCVECGLCIKVCPNKEENKIYDQKTYVAYCKNEEDKRRSASGGMFYQISKYILDRNGIVFGVTYNKNFSVIHDFAENLNEIKKFQGSKYVKSDLNNSFQKVEKFLKQEKYVLFSGTPCQCQGLRRYLNKDYEKLITCEIICHANPSPKVFKYYLQNLESLHRKKVYKIEFRSKKNGWKNQTPIIEFEDHTTIQEKSFRNAFASELINRPSCNNCKFSNIIRHSDFTIGDFWGNEIVCPEINDDDTGLSLLNVNTPKAKEVFNEIQRYLCCKEVDTNEAFSKNHHSNVREHKSRKKFFDGIKTGKINKNNIISYMEKYTTKSFFDRVLEKIKNKLTN